MEHFLENLFAWLPGGRLYYVILFSAALLESIVLAGLLVPGSTLLVFAGFLVAHGKGDLPTVVAVAQAGAFLGDAISYLLGGRIGRKLLTTAPFRKRLRLIRKAELFFAGHGGKSLFFGRFMGPLRGAVPFVAGLARMSPGTFLAYTLFSSVLWGLAYPGLGYLGAASWQGIQRWTGRLSLLLGSLLVLLVLNALFWKKIFPRLVERGGNLWIRVSRAWSRLLETAPLQNFADRHPRLWEFLAGRFSLRRGSGLYLTVGLTVSGLFSGCFFWLSENLGFFQSLDGLVYQMAGHYRHPLADRFLIFLTSLGDIPVLLLLAGAILVWLVLNNRDFSAAILLAGSGGGQLLVSLTKLFFNRERPIPYFPELAPESYSFPSGHAFSALVLGGLLVYFLLGTVRNWQIRLRLIITASFAVLLIGLSRCYLGLHWLSDVLAGFLLATIWLTFLLTALEIRRRFAGEFPWRTGWQPLRLTARQRWAILIPAFSAAMLGILYYILTRPGIF
jgi:membrane protein DedA with SNARE-associated domain/membrane-associated phospholipid phosphatase